MTPFKFLIGVEGYRREPYVPPHGKSGVTVGIGVDIGNMNPDKLDLPCCLKKKLRPYYGLKRDDAETFLISNPLKLTKAEVDLISIAAIEYHELELERWYNKASNIPFSMLDDPQKIVLLSVKYQYGNLPKRTPKFWKFATDNNWDMVYYELMNFGDNYTTRRHREAKLLIKAIKPTSPRE